MSPVKLKGYTKSTNMHAKVFQESFCLRMRWWQLGNWLRACPFHNSRNLASRPFAAGLYSSCLPGWEHQVALHSSLEQEMCTKSLNLSYSTVSKCQTWCFNTQVKCSIKRIFRIWCGKKLFHVSCDNVPSFRGVMWWLLCERDVTNRRSSNTLTCP